MATKVKNYELCPCGSGKKYLECHHIILWTKTNKWRALHTDESIIEIKKISTTIDSFYKDHISALEKKIIYAVDIEKEKTRVASYNMQKATDKLGFHTLIFANSNIATAKDSIIAHEYSHILLQEEKFPTIFPNPKNPRIRSFATQLNNILQDPLVYIRLKQIFKVEEDFIPNTKEFQEDITKEPLPDNGPLKLIYSLDCARTFLIQEALFGQKDTTGFRAFLESNHPNYIPVVTDIVGIFNEKGYDTPTKQNSIISKLTQKYPIIDAHIKVITL